MAQGRCAVKANDLTPGCYADGAFGHDHCRARLATLIRQFVDLREYDRTTHPTASEDLLASLEGPMPDDAWDEIDALDLLSDSTGLYWLFDGGDLIATESDDD